MVDTETIELAKQGNHQALAEILKSAESDIYKTSYYLTKNPEDAKDLTQDALLRIYEKFYTYQGQASIKVWAQRITTNIFLDMVRKKKAQIFSLDDNEAYHYIPDDSVSVENEVAGRIEGLELAKAIDKLADQYRIVIILRYLQDMSYREIAETLELPENTVKTHLFRARKLLKDLVENPWAEGVL